ncbi:hypothetical protein [Rhodonellum sp.]|nr:hypothetical protein [Rhodonellum sp.]MDO9553374.1 hypothetical protein [Rhodonellum sp.]
MDVLRNGSRFIPKYAFDFPMGLKLKENHTVWRISHNTDRVKAKTGNI